MQWNNRITSINELPWNNERKTEQPIDAAIDFITAHLRRNKKTNVGKQEESQDIVIKATQHLITILPPLPLCDVLLFLC